MKKIPQKRTEFFDGEEDWVRKLEFSRRLFGPWGFVLLPTVEFFRKLKVVPLIQST
jgi:hypothetical protein